MQKRCGVQNVLELQQNIRFSRIEALSERLNMFEKIYVNRFQKCIIKVMNLPHIIQRFLFVYFW